MKDYKSLKGVKIKSSAFDVNLGCVIYWDTILYHVEFRGNHPIWN